MKAVLVSAGNLTSNVSVFLGFRCIHRLTSSSAASLPGGAASSYGFRVPTRGNSCPDTAVSGRGVNFAPCNWSLSPSSGNPESRRSLIIIGGQLNGRVWDIPDIQTRRFMSSRPSFSGGSMRTSNSACDQPIVSKLKSRSRLSSSPSSRTSRSSSQPLSSARRLSARR